MPFTYVTVTHTFGTAQQAPAAGSIVFTPVEPMHNGVTVISAPVKATLSPLGMLSQVLAANTDLDTIPSGTTYKVVEQIVGQPLNTYYIQVPHNQGSTINLAVLNGWVGGAPTGLFVAAVNGEAPDGTGNLVLSASDVGAQPADADLTGLANLGDGVPVRTAGAWNVASGVRDGTRFLRDDGTWQTAGSSYTSENARDDIAGALVAGTNVTIVVNDAADTITISAATTGASGIPASTVTAKGDLIAGTANATVSRLGAGIDGQVLAASSGAATGLAWQTPAAAGIPSSTVDAKGDLLAGTADNTVARLGVGTNGQVLTASSGATTGLTWATPSTGPGSPATVDAGNPPAGLTAVSFNGTTNDQPALQAILNYVQSTYGGGRVILSKPSAVGNAGPAVRLGSGITIPAKVQLVSDETTLIDASPITTGAAITVNDTNFTPLVGIRMEGGKLSPTTSDYTSTYTGVKVTGNGLRFEKVSVKYFGRGIDLATSNTWGAKFVGGIAQNCAVGVYADHEAAGTTNSGEELVFDGFDLANNVRAWWATGNGTGMQFSNLSMDYSSGDIGKCNNSRIFIRGCHVETSAGSYVFDVTGNTQFHAMGTRFTLGQMLLFKTAQGPSNYGFGKARFDACEVFFTDNTATGQNVSSEHYISWPASTTSMSIYVPFPLKGWCAVHAAFVLVDAYYVPNSDVPLITSRNDLTGQLTITSPSNAAQRFIRLKF